MEESRPQHSGSPARFGRRAFIGAAGGAAIALLVPVRPRSGALLSLTEDASQALAAEPFRARLPIPRELTGSDLRIPIREAEVQVLPGRKTRMWTYGGSFPGPTIRRRAGRRTKVTFFHELPEAKELSVHLHGGHNISRFDGQPGGLTALHRRSLYCQIPDGLSERRSGNDLLIRPGRRKTYVYELMEDGRGERASFQWYHDHRLDHTAPNVWRGLAGMWIIDDAFDDSLPLPSGDRDLQLMIGDRSFDRHNQLTNPFAPEARPPRDGVTGSHILVNGAFLPHHRVSARRYRLRILNVSNFRPYNLFLSNGEPLVQIASDSGLMPKPVRRRQVLLGPGERAEVVVDFGAAAGKSVELRSGRRHDGKHALGSRPYVGPLMQFRVGRRRRDRTRVPRTLRPLPRWASTASEAPDRTWVLTFGRLFRRVWTINGRTFNPARADAHPVLGTTETWQITNATAFTHIMHMHHTDWYMLSRNGRKPKPWEDCLKETFFVEPGDTILVAGHFSDYIGKYVIHCHMLDHEDHGMMGQFKVVRNRASQPRSDEVARRRRGEIPAPAQAPSLGLPDSLAAADRMLEFEPLVPDGERLQGLDVSINGQHERSLSGAALRQPLSLPLADSGLTRVTLVGHTADGRLLGATRDYP
jgi:FtsP/CotA-like multicopper oxidase with cupredoxin domain